MRLWDLEWAKIKIHGYEIKGWPLLEWILIYWLSLWKIVVVASSFSSIQFLWTTFCSSGQGSNMWPINFNGMSLKDHAQSLLDESCSNSLEVAVFSGTGSWRHITVSGVRQWFILALEDLALFLWNLKTGQNSDFYDSKDTNVEGLRWNLCLAETNWNCYLIYNIYFFPKKCDTL